jgi:hypothetical protein
VPSLLDQIPSLPENGVPEEIDKDVDYGEELGYLAYRSKELEVSDQAHELRIKEVMLLMRKIFAVLLFLMSVSWLGFIGWIIVRAGTGWYPSDNFFGFLPFQLSDSVLIALITTTTINVLGLFFAVTRWLFPNAKITSDAS